MKIILATKSVWPFHPAGGVQKCVYYLAKFLRKRNLDIEVVSPLDRGKPRTEIFEHIKYTFLSPAIFWYLEYPVGWLGVHLFSLSLARYLQRIDFDLLHSFDMVGYQYLKVNKRKPVISQIFTDNYLSNPISMGNPADILSLFGRRTGNIKKKKVKISPNADSAVIRKYPVQYFFKIKPMNDLLHASDCIFFEEEMFLKEATEIFKLENKRKAVVPIGTDTALINRAIERSSLSRADIGLRPDDLVLITVNRLAADKGIDKIILALSELIQEIPRPKLIIVGSGYQEKEIQSLIAKKNLGEYIRHFKQVSEDTLYSYYALSDIFISAFSYPGSSVSTLEAMACGLPVITSGQPWLVKKGNGVALETNEPYHIRHAVLKLIRDHQLKKQGEISKDIVREYDWDKISELVLKQYENVLS